MAARARIAVLGSSAAAVHSLADELGARLLAEDHAVEIETGTSPAGAARAGGVPDLTLLLATDQSGPADSSLRKALDDAGRAYAIVTHLAQALAAFAASQRTPPPAGLPRWHHACAECGDPDCERHLLPRRVQD